MRASNSNNHNKIIVSELHRLGFKYAESACFDLVLDPFITIKYDFTATDPAKLLEELVRQSIKRGIDIGQYQLRNELKNLLGVRQ